MYAAQREQAPADPTSKLQSAEGSARIGNRDAGSAGTAAAATAVTRLDSGGEEEQSVEDPLIYPDIYAPSGFDMLGILVRTCYSLLIGFLLAVSPQRP